MTTMMVDPELIHKAMDSDTTYGSDNCSRAVYRVGDFVIKVRSWGGSDMNEREMDNYHRIKELLAKQDTYDGIRFGVASMENVDVPGVGAAMICELIEGRDVELNRCCQGYSGQCAEDLCWVRVKGVVKYIFGITDMHYANWILRDGVVVMIDIED